MDAQEITEITRRVCTDLILAVYKAVQMVPILEPDTMPDAVWEVLNGDRLLTAKAISSGGILAQEEIKQNVVEAIEKVLEKHRDVLNMKIIVRTEEETLQ